MSIASEEYRPIKDFENYYEISNLGNIKSVDRYVKCKKNSLRLLKGKILKTHINKKTGYVMVHLFKNGKQYNYLVHRLVVQNFPEICGKMFDGCEVDHIDTNRINNRVDNLKICTRHENHLNPLTRINYKKCAEHFKGHIPWNKGLKFPEKSGANHFSAKAVRQLDKNGNEINRYSTIIEASRITNILRTSIDNCLNKRSKTAGGYCWEYITGGVVN